MRVEPSARAQETTEDKKVRNDNVIRKVAIAFAFICVFYFFIKLLFL